MKCSAGVQSSGLEGRDQTSWFDVKALATAFWAGEMEGARITDAALTCGAGDGEGNMVKGPTGAA